jgi:hypothetical protein
MITIGSTIVKLTSSTDKILIFSLNVIDRRFMTPANKLNRLLHRLGHLKEIKTREI